MELGSILGLIAIALIIFVMFQIHTLFTRKSEPDIIVNNYIQGTEKSIDRPFGIKGSSGTGNEVPIDTLTVVKDVDGEVNLTSENLGKSDTTETISKIKILRDKK